MMICMRTVRGFGCGNGIVSDPCEENPPDGTERRNRLPPVYNNDQEYNRGRLGRCHESPFTFARIEYQDFTPSVWRRVFVANYKPRSRWFEAITENLRFSWTAPPSSTVVRWHFLVFCLQEGRSSQP